MRTLSLLALLFLLMASAASMEDKKPVDIQTLKADADKAVAKAQAANPKDCTKDCLDAARKLVDLADQYFTAGNVTDARAAMDQAGQFALKAGRDSIDTKKRRKDVEIGLRKLQRRISEIEESLNFDDRAPVHKIVTSISKTRSDILMSMFDMPKKELGPQPADKENP